MPSTVLSGPPADQIFQQIYADLKSKKSKATPRRVKDGPWLSIRFSPGKQVKPIIRATELRKDDPLDLWKAYALCEQIDSAADPLELMPGKKADVKRSRNWIEAAEAYRCHLERKGIKIHDQAQSRHIGWMRVQPGELTIESLMARVEEEPSDKRSRIDWLTTVERLSMVLDLELPTQWLRRMKSESTYSSSRVINPRNIPRDNQIEAFIDSIENPQWKTAFALIATYGLRPVEVFSILEVGLDDDGWVELTSPKTNVWRTVMPARQDWIDRWDLHNAVIPEVTPGTSLKALGHRVTSQFARYRELAIWRDGAQCYDLRHAYAARFHTSRQFKQFTVEDAAKFMGHTVKIHQASYTKWIKKNDLKRAAKERAKSKLITISVES